MIENEIRILNVNVEEFKKILSENRAVHKFSALQKRYIYDFNPVDPNKWIRLRTNGKINTLTIKEIIDNSKVDGTKELEIEVDNIEITNKILNMLGYYSRNYQENYREMYLLDDCEVCIDYWPLIRPYVEIEGKSVEAVDRLVKKLGINESNITTKDVTTIFNDNGIDIKKIKELKFEGGIPENMLEYNK